MWMSRTLSKTSRLFQSQGTDTASILPHGALSNKCYMNLNVEWVIESESSVYATPLVDSFSWLRREAYHFDDFLQNFRGY